MQSAVTTIVPDAALPVEPASKLRWPSVLAKLVAVWALVTVIAGGVVTSTRSGDADPYWPSFGGSLLPSIEKMLQDLKLLLEHNHRMLAGTLGFLTLGLAVVIHRSSEPRRWVRGLGWTAAVIVMIIGVLGGVRLKFPDVPWLPIVHVSVAYPFLGLCVAIAVVTGRVRSAMASGAAMACDAEPSKRLKLEDATWLSRGSIACALLLYCQAVLGAVPRHLYVGAIAHIFGAFVAFTVVMLVATRVLSKHSKLPSLLRPAALLVLLVVAQFFLGFTSFVVRPEGPKAPGTSLFEIVASGHQAVGALLIVTSVVLMTRAIQQRSLSITSAVSQEGGGAA